MLQRYGNKFTWLQYKGLISAIPLKWKNIIKEEYENETNMMRFYDLVYKKVKKVWYLYQESRRAEAEPIWIKVLSELREQEGHIYFQNIWVITSITKLRDFQFRLLHGTIYTNTILFHWKLVPLSICNLCGESDQTIEHLFITCPKVVRLWEGLKDFMETSTLININALSFTTATILLNIVHVRPKHLANLLVLITNQYVYACKCLNTQPNIFEIISKIETIFQCERYDACCKLLLRNHQTNGSCI